MNFAQQLKSQVDIVRIVGEYVRLKKAAGSSRWIGLCPFHSEKTPSFGVNAGQQFYKCFGCGVGGDVIKFVMEIEGLTFFEALTQLAERNGIPMPKRSEYSDDEAKLRTALMEMHEIAARVFEENLTGPDGAAARSYLQKRGLSRELIEEFRLGYSDASGQALVRRFENRFTPQQMEASGLVRRRESGGYYDAFRGRLMFPIQNEKGNVIAFGGRALRDADEPKYLNSPETPIYLKKSVLYNLHRAKDGMRRNGRAVLVEGYMDVIGVFSAGVNEVVASCGTALTNLQVRAMHRHADTVVVNFDSDTAGQNAAEKSIQLLLEESLYVHVLELDGGLDPDEYVKAHGADQYVARLDRAETYFHWLADRARKRFDLRSAEGRVDALKFLLPHVLKVRDKIERVSVANDLAEYLRLDKDLILDQFRKAATDRKSAAPSRPREVLPDVEKILLDALIRSEAARQEILPQLAESALVERLTGQRIFHALLNAAPDGAGFDFSHFENQLTEPEKILLHDAISSDGIEEEQVLLTQATACLAKLEQAQIREEIQELRRRVQEAERQGSIEEAIRLTVALGDLEKRAAQQASAAGKTAL